MCKMCLTVPCSEMSKFQRVKKFAYAFRDVKCLSVCMKVKMA